MKKSIMLFLAFCSVIALLVAPGIVAADTFVFPSPANNNQGLGNYRDFDLFSQITLNVVNITNGVELFDPPPAQILYTPTASQPGYVPGENHTYVIDIVSPTGGRLLDVPGLDPVNNAVSGLLVLTDHPGTAPTTAAGWLDPNFLASVDAIVAFVPGVSTACIYENDGSVPEPGVLLLLSCGLIGLAGMRRAIKK